MKQTDLKNQTVEAARRRVLGLPPIDEDVKQRKRAVEMWSPTKGVGSPSSIVKDSDTSMAKKTSPTGRRRTLKKTVKTPGSK